jgi:hypothetical protein
MPKTTKKTTKKSKPRKPKVNVDAFQDKNILAKINEPACDPDSQWLDVEALSVHLRRLIMIPCWADVEPRLAAGEPSANLARYIKDVRGQASWLKHITLTRYLTELRSKMPVVDRLGIDSPGYRKKLQEVYGDRFAEVDRLAELEMIQRERYMTLVAEERFSGKHNPETKHEMVLMKAILRDMADLKRELGIAAADNPESAGIPVETVNRIRAKYGEDAAKTLLNPASQGRILAAIKLAEAAAGVKGLDTRKDYRQPGEEESSMIIDVESEVVEDKV